MPFTTDQQTLEDLNIFGRHGTDSLFTLFNRTFTRGGAAILEDWFRYPLGDENAINHRSSIIRFFAAAKTSFPFKTEAFDQAELYLANTDERTRLIPGDLSLREKMSGLIAEDSTYRTIHKGVLAILDLLRRLQDFLVPFDTGTPYRSEIDLIHHLLSAASIRPILWEESHRKLPYAKVAAYDAVFRFREHGNIRKLLSHIYLLDVYISAAHMARDRNLAFAVALPKKEQTVHLEGLFHPQVKNAVTNDLDITPDGNLLFLTGANMAGKSTFMKSLGIALYLAHMGMPVPASKMTFSLRDGIYTTINLPDNLGMGASHFYAEVLRIKKIAHELSASKSLFVIFDELFRGTNVKDAYEATISLTTSFAARHESMFVISTHIIEAGDVLKQQCPTIDFIYLPTLMKGNIPVYTYKLEKGITADRHGMVIIHNEGILDLLKNGHTKPKKRSSRIH